MIRFSPFLPYGLFRGGAQTSFLSVQKDNVNHFGDDLKQGIVRD